MAEKQKLSGVYAVASDIHGDARRLIIFNDSNERDPEKTIILGDIVEGNLFDQKQTELDNACVDIVRNRGFMAVRGNHCDLAAELSRYPKLAEQYANDKTLPSFMKNMRHYLPSLQRQIQIGNCLFAHTFPIDEDKRIKTLADAKEAFDELSERHPDVAACFVGHYHEPVCFYQDIKTRECGEEKGNQIQLSPGRKYIINPGSLGAREIGNYILFDADKRIVKRVRVE
jgi:predicted phosphodiesterase